MKNNKKIGFIGQGWIGKNYADDFEKRGYNVVRYSMEEPHVKNGDKIGDCDIVFIAVPTPTTTAGFDDSILRKVIKLIGKGKVAVIKSTILPGTTQSIQDENPNIFVCHSPEFLREASAADDASNPNRNIIGIPKDTDEFRNIAENVMRVLPKAPYEKVCSAHDAELVKYGGNCFLYFKVVYANLFYDIAQKLGCDWDTISDMISADPRIGPSHMDPVHKKGRGAGGNCFIKDFAVFAKMYKELMNNDEHGHNVLDSLQKKNIDLLLDSNKDLNLLKGVFGDDVVKK
ncbi:hypothetical protein KAU19_07480 [Candidatus Parcubacteria bacterium]|nr:hypothetical protein [Candidatus Parcubacteria bacterium]